MFKTVCILTVAAVLSCAALVGCGSSGASGVDAPLTKATGTPPPKPNKPVLTPSGGSGPAPAGTNAPKGAQTTP